MVLVLQMGKTERPRPLDDPTRPYIKFDIVAHLDSLSSHEGKRVNPVSVVSVHIYLTVLLKLLTELCTDTLLMKFCTYKLPMIPGC